MTAAAQRPTRLSFAWWPDLSARRERGPKMVLRAGAHVTVVVLWPSAQSQDDFERQVARGLQVQLLALQHYQLRRLLRLADDWSLAAHDWYDAGDGMLGPALSCAFDNLLALPANTPLRRGTMMSIASELDGLGRPVDASYYRRVALGHPVQRTGRLPPPPDESRP